MKTRQTIFTRSAFLVLTWPLFRCVQTLEIALKMWHLVPFLVPKSGPFAPGASRFMSLQNHELEREPVPRGPES